MIRSMVRENSQDDEILEMILDLYYNHIRVQLDGTKIARSKLDSLFIKDQPYEESLKPMIYTIAGSLSLVLVAGLFKYTSLF